MTITVSAHLQHWNFFLALEDDLLRLSRFVDFSGNSNTYSLEIGRLLMGAAAEADVILKQLCARWDPQAKAGNLEAYYRIVAANRPEFRSFKVTIPRFGLSMKPWVSWKAGQAPLWWRAHNKVKHERHTRFKDATLKHCLNAAAGLFVSVLFLYPNQARDGFLLPPARLFDVGDEHNLGQFIDRHIAPMFDVPV